MNRIVWHAENQPRLSYVDVDKASGAGLAEFKLKVENEVKSVSRRTQFQAIHTVQNDLQKHWAAEGS
jgi:hypothetical protein